MLYTLVKYSTGKFDSWTNRPESVADYEKHLGFFSPQFAGICQVAVMSGLQVFSNSRFCGVEINSAVLQLNGVGKFAGQLIAVCDAQ